MEDFGDKLINWYKENKRDLPWRRSKDPYKIWLSEIILQQTRVDQGLPYYIRFVEYFPDVFKLAAAAQDQVFKLWQGLGYYSRAANMISTAKTIVEKYNGIFPDSRDELLKLKGVGSYTSAAIASLAFEEPVAVVDGNVYRAISRIFGINTPINTSRAKKEFDKIATELMGNHAPGVFNQALMEFGALYCKPRNPNCQHCIFQANCFAFATNSVEGLPVKKSKPVVKKRYFYYFLIEIKQGSSELLYIRKRKSKDIWKNLYDFPIFESNEKIEPLKTIYQTFFFKPGLEKDVKVGSISHEYKHLLSHQKIHAQFIRLIVDKKFIDNRDNSLLLIDKKELIKYPVPRLIEKYLQDYKIIKEE